MSSYSPPTSNLSIYNNSNYILSSSSLSTSSADLRYLKLTGSVSGGLQTFNGGVSSSTVSISNTTASTSSTTGALQVAGGAYFGNSSIINNQLSVTGVGNASTLTALKLNSYDTVNSYIQNNIQNLSSGTSASSDWIATCNNGNDSTGFIDMGINSSGFTQVIGAASDSYLYCVADLASNGGNLWIGTQSAKSIYLFANTLLPTISNSMSFNGTNFKTIGLSIGLNGTTYSQELFGNFSLTNPNIIALGNTTQVVSFSNSFSSAPNVIACINSTAAPGVSMNFLLVSAFSITTSQCTITITNTNPAMTTTGSISISWKAFV